MRLTNVAVLLSVALWLPVSGLILAGSEDDLRVASDSTLAAAQAAIKDKDSGKLLSLLSDDAAVITENGRVVQGYMTLRTALMAVFLLSGGSQVSIDRYSLNLIDSTGYETGQYTVKQSLENGSEKKYTGKFTLIWKKESGRWKVHRAIAIP